MTRIAFALFALAICAASLWGGDGFERCHSEHSADTCRYALR